MYFSLVETALWKYQAVISYDGTKVQVLSEDLDIDLKKTVQFKDKDGINNIVTVAKKGSTEPMSSSR